MNANDLLPLLMNMNGGKDNSGMMGLMSKLAGGGNFSIADILPYMQNMNGAATPPDTGGVNRKSAVEDTYNDNLSDFINN